MPSVTVCNRQRSLPINRQALHRFAVSALNGCLAVPRRGSDLLAELRQIDVVLVSDKQIAEIHKRFLDDATPTDVITFQHGEIVVSVETAKRQARRYRTSLEVEVRLYIVHGLLHLHGYSDKTAAGAAEMKRLQGRIVAQVDDR